MLNELERPPQPLGNVDSSARLAAFNLTLDT